MVCKPFIKLTDSTHCTPMTPFNLLVRKCNKSSKKYIVRHYYTSRRTQPESLFHKLSILPLCRIDENHIKSSGHPRQPFQSVTSYQFYPVRHPCFTEIVSGPFGTFLVQFDRNKLCLCCFFGHMNRGISDGCSNLENPSG